MPTCSWPRDFRARTSPTAPSGPTSRPSGSASTHSRACSRSRSHCSTRRRTTRSCCMSHEFVKVGEERIWDGKIISVGVERFRHADGEEVTREKVWHPGAVGILAVGDDYVWLTRQPREAAGMRDSVEIPAGKLDVPGEPPIETAKRELIEEVGVTAESWSEIYAFFTS